MAHGISLLRKPEKSRYVFGRGGKYEVTVANTLDERKRAWKMVYQSYLEKRYAKPDPEGLWYGLYDALPQISTFLVTKDGEDVATVSIVLDSEFGLPADELFKDKMDELRCQGRRLCEVISLSCVEADRRKGIEIVKHMFKVALYAACKTADATDFVITVHPHHAGYYERRLLFIDSGEIRSYGKVNGTLAAFLRLDLETLSDTYREHYGTKDGSIWHHFFDPAVEFETVRFLAENTTQKFRGELIEWFAAKKPATLKRVRDYLSPFDIVGGEREQQMAAGAMSSVVAEGNGAGGFSGMAVG